MRDQGWPGITAAEKPLSGIERQAALDGFRIGCMAFVAVLNEDRADFLFEEIQLLRVWIGASTLLSHRSGRNERDGECDEGYKKARGMEHANSAAKRGAGVVWTGTQLGGTFILTQWGDPSHGFWMGSS